eukprot:c26832_g1_i2 orf=288-1526(-)
MFLVHDKAGAIALMIAALCFLGTWPALLTLLERRGRLPQHTYLDYSITNFLAAVIIAFSFGQIGSSTPDSPDFLTQLGQDNGPSVAFAMAGGLVLSMGNLATQYAWAYVGLSVTEVVSSSITVVIGTTMNYFLDYRINRAEILFPGVGCFLIAVCLGSAVHASNSNDNNAKLGSIGHQIETFDVENSLQSLTKRPGNSFEIQSGLADEATGQANGAKVKVGSAEFLQKLEERRAIKIRGSKAIFGLGIVVFSGLCFSLFSPAFNLATNDQWRALKPGVPHLVVYTAFFYFSVSCLVLGILLNAIFLYHPICGLPKSSFTSYISDWNGRHWALLAGFLCGFGNGFQFMGGQAAGYAAADAVQALPLVSTIWAVLLFGEYRCSSRKTYSLLLSMLLMFIIAVGVLMGSSGHRKS